MSDAPTPVPMIDEVFAGLRRSGFSVRRVAINPRHVARPNACRLLLLFGEEAQEELASAMDVACEIGIRGDIATGEMQHWVISRALEPLPGAPGVNLEISLLLDGDISAAFLLREARAGHNILLALLADAIITLSDLPPPRVAGRVPAPVVIVHLDVIGDVATGRSGLLHREGGVHLATDAERHARLAVCRRLSVEIVPGLATACANALAQVRPLHIRDYGVNEVRRATVDEPSAGFSPNPHAASPIDDARAVLRAQHHVIVSH